MLMLASLLAKSLFMLCDTPVHVYNVYAWCNPRVRVCVYYNKYENFRKHAK